MVCLLGAESTFYAYRTALSKKTKAQKMIIRARVIPCASRALVKKERDCFKVYVNKPSREGLANAQAIELLADHFKVKKYRIKIIRGGKSRNKIIQIDDA